MDAKRETMKLLQCDGDGWKRILTPTLPFRSSEYEVRVRYPPDRQLRFRPRRCPKLDPRLLVQNDQFASI